MDRDGIRERDREGMEDGRRCEGVGRDSQGGTG